MFTTAHDWGLGPLARWATLRFAKADARDADAVTTGGGPRPSSAGDDAELLGAVARGDARALASVYDRHAGVAYSLLCRMLGDADEAEDALQEVFLKVWRNAARFDPAIGTATTWIARLARNHAIDRMRSSGRAARLAAQPIDVDAPGAEPAAPQPTPPAHTEAAENAAWVRRCLGELPREQRVAIELAYFDHLSQSQIAAKLGEPLGTVKTRMRTGLMRLRESLRARIEVQP